MTQRTLFPYFTEMKHKSVPAKTPPEGGRMHCPHKGAIVLGRVMGASLTFDHRIVSGVPAGLFLKTFHSCFGLRI